MKALVFDLDGTLADATFHHVIAWHRAFTSAGLNVPAAEIHYRIGMQGELMLQALSHAFNLGLSATQTEQLAAEHGKNYRSMRDGVKLLPHADEVGDVLGPLGIRWAIVTSAHKADVQPLLQALHAERAAAVITGDDERESKPSAHPIRHAFQALGVEPHDAGVVGDAVWDMLASREAGSFGIGVLTGGIPREDLTSSGAFRVYRDVGEMLARLEEIGIRRDLNPRRPSASSG